MAPTQGTETTLQLQRTFAAPASKVFEAWTRPEIMKRWFGPSDDFTVTDCQADVRLGGAYRVAMRHSGGDTHTAFGTYREIVTNEKLVFTWAWEGENAHVETLVTVTLVPKGNQTELTLTHERFPSVEARDSHQQGWAGTFERLAAALG
jgi:uncharacterized protein YndB with AHSA1/START domain